MKTVLLVWAGISSLSVLGLSSALAQTTENPFGASDTATTISTRTPIMYDTSYDRDVSSGTWIQTLAYSFAHPRVSFSATGNYTAVDLVRSPGLGGQNGTMSGMLNFRAKKNWTLGLVGNFNHLSSHDIVSETIQRQNRLKLTSQYTINPLRMMNLNAVLSTEFQQDHGLTVRPLGQGSVRLLTRYDAAGDSVGVDSVFVHDQRDSTFMDGRQDGLVVNMNWRLKPWLQITGAGSGTRVNSTTRSNLRDFGIANGMPLEITDRAAFESPNVSQIYQSKMMYTGNHGLLASVDLRRVQNNQQYFEKLLRNQEHLSINQRNGNAHLEYIAFRGAQIVADGALNRSFSEYTLRSNRNSLVSVRTGSTSFNYTPSSASRAGLSFTVDRRENQRQTTGNGTTLMHSLLGSISHRLSRRLGLDAAGNVSLISSQYVDSILDEDNLRTYVNLGGLYVLSERCSTTVHFSSIRAHSIAVDASRSGNNNIQSTYQMNATMRLGVTPRLSLVQIYLINAIYQIYDDYFAEQRNTLSRIKRIDTTISDSLFTFATVQLVHNYLFRDSGSFSRPSTGKDRLYNVGSETTQQTLSATINVRAADGVLIFATQSLGNTRVHFPFTDTNTTDNHWNLAVGANVDQAIPGGMALRGSVQHIGAYTERLIPTSSLNEQDDWLASVTFHKEF